MMKSLPFLSRRARRSTLEAPSSLRVEVCPPSLRQAPDSTWQRAMFWLLAPAPQDASPAPSRLHAVRSDFTALLADIDTDAARALCRRIADAGSLRELWHLRAEAYRVIHEFQPNALVSYAQHYRPMLPFRKWHPLDRIG